MVHSVRFPTGFWQSSRYSRSVALSRRWDAIHVTPFRQGLIVILALAAAMVVVVTETLISNAVASRWVRDDPFPVSGIAAVVVLSAALNANGWLRSPQLAQQSRAP